MIPIDLTKLTPAPWAVAPYDPEFPDGVLCVKAKDGPIGGRDDLEFAALARNAFDVMMRRNWTVAKHEGWYACTTTGISVVLGSKMPRDKFYHADPFTALVEADAWYKQNVEAAPEAK